MQNRNHILIQDILSRIESADDLEISEIIHAIIRRYRKIYPDEEILFLSLPKNNPQERNRIICSALNLLKRQ